VSLTPESLRYFQIITLILLCSPLTPSISAQELDISPNRTFVVQIFNQLHCELTLQLNHLKSVNRGEFKYIATTIC